MTKDRKNLFVQFTFLFVLSAGVILLALFFTRDPDGSDSGDSQQQQLYAEFKNFDKLKPQLLQLVDGINAQVNIIQAENGGNNTASYTANNLIDDFQRRYNPQQDTFALKVTDMLRLYLQAATETKAFTDQKKGVDHDYEECKQEKIGDLLDSRSSDGTTH
jgi:hypothetical protein